MADLIFLAKLFTIHSIEIYVRLFLIKIVREGEVCLMQSMYHWIGHVKNSNINMQ